MNVKNARAYNHIWCEHAIHWRDRLRNVCIYTVHVVMPCTHHLTCPGVCQDRNNRSSLMFPSPYRASLVVPCRGQGWQIHHRHTTAYCKTNYVAQDKTMDLHNPHLQLKLSSFHPGFSCTGFDDFKSLLRAEAVSPPSLVRYCICAGVLMQSTAHASKTSSLSETDATDNACI